MEDNKNKKVPNVPTLRFPEFSDEWEKTTLGNISNIKIYQPQTIKPLNFGKYKVFGANGYIGYYKEYNHNTNQVTISCRGEKSGIVNFVESFVWITGNSMVLNLDKTSEIIKKFLYYELIINNVNYLITGSGQPQLTRDNLVQHKIYFPNIDEQTKIADFLSLIDKRIELQIKIIKDYELLKKLLMNKFLSNFNLREISIYSLVKSQLIRIIKASELKKFNGTKSYLSTSSIDENGSISPEKEISFFDRPSRASMIPYRNSVWFAKMKDTNKVYISKNNDEEKYILSTGFYGILPIENDIDPIWLFEIFKSKYFIVQKDKLSEGGTMSGIKDSQLNELNIKIWLDKEMQNFACKLLKSFTKIIEIELGKENSLIKLKSYLLKTLFI